MFDPSTWLMVFFVIGVAVLMGFASWCWPSQKADAEDYRREVEAEVAKRLAAERFEADVKRRLQEARGEVRNPAAAEKGE